MKDLKHPRIRFWKSLPVGEWVKRDDVDWESESKARNRSGDFQRALSYYFDRDMIELEFFYVEGKTEKEQFIRKRTAEEMQVIGIDKKRYI